jgi:hypothetical protein
MSWCRTPSGAYDQIFITVWQLRSCFCGAPSLTRGRVCLLYMLLDPSSAVFLGTRDHILLSQIWDFPFCRLLRLAGSRWRYSTPPPNGWLSVTQLLRRAQLSNEWVAPIVFLITPLHWPSRKHRFQQKLYCCTGVFNAPLPSNRSIRHNILKLEFIPGLPLMVTTPRFRLRRMYQCSSYTTRLQDAFNVSGMYSSASCSFPLRFKLDVKLFFFL